MFVKFDCLYPILANENMATSGSAWFIREKGKCSSFSFETPWRWPGIDSIVDNGLRRKCIPRVRPNKK